MKIFLPLTLFIVAFTSCKSQTVSPDTTRRDTTITRVNAVSELFLDSNTLEAFIVTNGLKDSAVIRLRSFYNSRNFQFAWFTKDGLAEHTRAFINLHNNYIQLAKDYAVSDNHLHDQMKRLINEDTVIATIDEKWITLELQLTQHFFKFVQHAYYGRLNPSDLQWNIPRKKVDVKSLLDSLIATKGAKPEQWEPVNQQYKLMDKELIRYAGIEEAGGWKLIQTGNQKIDKLVDKSTLIKQVKKRLAVEGLYSSNDTSQILTPKLSEAITQAQKRYGLKPDGQITASLIKQLNVPIQARIETLLINMERMRWMPAEPEGNRIMANIPDFKLHVFEDSKKIFDIKIVVGTTAHKTVVFNDVLQYIVFSPYWNVPASIVRNEILPAINKNPAYLAKHNMEQTGRENGLPVIRQKPGGQNALGKVKFLFPNSYNIYFHDTPSKHLFNNEKRAFSHGCIRLAEPRKLAEYLLRNNPEWTKEKIGGAMSLTKEKWVKLDQPLPVLVTYFTAWIDGAGVLNFREDVYGNDKKMAEHLFKEFQ